MNIGQIIKIGEEDLKKKKGALLSGKTLNNVLIDGLWVGAKYYAVEDFIKTRPSKKIPILIQLSRLNGSKIFLVGFFKHEFLTEITYVMENENLEMIMNIGVIPNSYGFYYEEEAYDFFMDLNERFKQEQTGNTCVGKSRIRLNMVDLGCVVSLVLSWYSPLCSYVVCSHSFVVACFCCCLSFFFILCV